ncbi:MAG: capsule assembly Wzi family protein, partial [Sediminibacterium sp.]
MRFTWKKLVGVLIVLFFFNKAISQSIPVGTVGDEYLRILQLEGKIDPTISFTSRPNFLNSKLTRDSFYKYLDSNLIVHKSLKNKFFEFRPVMAQIRTQYNSLLPYGWNDEGMIKARGIQSLSRFGLYTRIGPLHIQYIPEYVNAENAIFDTSAEYGRQPRGRYLHNFLGQTSARLNLGKISVGYSNENLFWGPGQYGALIMSNNAPGFSHYTINTLRPIKSIIGSFEFQLVTGRLEQDPTMPFEAYSLQLIGWNNQPRIFNGLNIVYQPKFLPNLFIGINRAYQYSENLIDKQGTGFVSK